MIYITLGDGVDLGIDTENHLFIRQMHNGKVTNQIDLGRATGNRIAWIKTYLDQLSIHAVEEKVVG